MIRYRSVRPDLAPRRSAGQPPRGSDVSRRQFVVGSAMVAALGPTFLAACGGDEGASSGEDAPAGGGSGAGAVRIASWPLYIENDLDPATAKTIVDYVAATGNQVDYQVAIDGNDSFTAKYQADLEKKADIGFDVAVPTSWMAARWIERGWTQPLPALANKANLIASLANPDWDPGRAASLPGYIGQAGIAYFPDKVGFEITSASDLLKPELKGKVTLLNEMRDSVGLVMLSMGMDPATATVDEAKRAIEVIAKARKGGQFRKISGNSYIEDLAQGQVAAAIAWSGDVGSLQAENPDLRWATLSHPLMSFVDTFVIPAGGNAELGGSWINFLYDPKVSGPLMEAISYTSPVQGAGEYMSEEARTNPLVNPGTSVELREFRPLSAAEAEELETAFAEATQQ